MATATEIQVQQLQDDAVITLTEQEVNALWDYMEQQEIDTEDYRMEYSSGKTCVWLA